MWLVRYPQVWTLRCAWQGESLQDFTHLDQQPEDTHDHIPTVWVWDSWIVWCSGKKKELAVQTLLHVAHLLYNKNRTTPISWDWKQLSRIRLCGHTVLPSNMERWCIWILRYEIHTKTSDFDNDALALQYRVNV